MLMRQIDAKVSVTKRTEFISWAEMLQEGF
jgi:hypothetical protein